MLFIPYYNIKQMQLSPKKCSKAEWRNFKGTPLLFVVIFVILIHERLPSEALLILGDDPLTSFQVVSRIT